MTDVPYRWHACPVTGPVTPVDPAHLALWERLPDALRADYVNAIVAEDTDVEAAGWPHPQAVRKTGPRDRALAAILGHMRVTEPPRWLRPLAEKVAEGVRDRCVYCMHLRREPTQEALPGLWSPPPKVAPTEAPRPAAVARPMAPATTSNVLPTGVALQQLREGLQGMRRKA